jgi:hypothetical protein
MGNVPGPSRRGFSRAITIALTAAFSLSLILAGTTSAATPHSWKDDHLLYLAPNYDTTQECVGASDAWLGLNNSGKDSPLDSNIRGWKVVVPAVNPEIGNCAVSGWTDASLVLNKPIATVKNVSFDWRGPTGNPPGTGVGGSPRISLYFGTLADPFQHVLFMDGVSCWKPIGAFGWRRSDFTGMLSTEALCTMNLDGVFYTNTPTQSAWAVMAAAEPTLVAQYSFIVMDQPGTYYLDRMVLGTQRLYGSKDSPDKTCTTEASC